MTTPRNPISPKEMNKFLHEYLLTTPEKLRKDFQMIQPYDTRKKVIIIEDDADLLKLMIYSFESVGFQAVGIENGKDALLYLKDEMNTPSISLVVLDRLLPDMDGLDILKQLPDSFKSRIPVLILSVLSSEQDVLSGLKKGAFDYIAKPFNLPIMMEKALNLIKPYPK